MMSTGSSTRSVLMAMLCAGGVTAQFIGGKAARDALYFSNFDPKTLPAMVIGTSFVSIILVAISAKIFARLSPSTFVPALFTGSALLLLAEWALTYEVQKAAAVLVYLHISGLGPMLGSGFWLIASERFDPRTAKRRVGQIQSAGTFVGLLGVLFADRVAVTFGTAAMLPVLAALNVGCAFALRQLALPRERDQRARPPGLIPELAPAAPRTGLRVLADAPYLRHLAALVMLSTMSAMLLDYIFKVQARSTFGSGFEFRRFFVIYYSATSLITFLLQTSSSRVVLERLGLGWTAAMPSVGLIAGSVGGLFVPGITTMTIARGGESVLRGSFFRAGYELFYTPVPAAEKRAAKSIIDVGFDRLGDLLGAGVVQLVLVLLPAPKGLLLPASHYIAILSTCIAFSAVAVFVASRLNLGYMRALEKSLLNRALEIELSDIEDLTTRTLILQTIVLPGVTVARPSAAESERRKPNAPTGSADPELQAIMRLRSRDRVQVASVLRSEEGLTPALVPHVIPLLAWDPVAADAVFALRKVAEERVGEFVDVLIDPNQDFAIRRRLARVFSVCVSQRAVDGLMLGLDDLRFEVRFQCGHSLAAIVDKNPMVRIDRDRIFANVLREVAVGRSVWESRKLLERLDIQEAPSFVDEVVRDRAGQSLAHVFTLLSLVLPREPLQIAFRSLHTADQQLQGTALEYLEGVLPPQIRERLWPFLEDRRPAKRSDRSRDEILEELLRSNESIIIRLEELQQRAQAATPVDTAPTKVRTE